ncbi:DUF4097 family beta strand repeat-containing protein [Nocardioides houyundeii]|uniref:DUF4097 family beta strand repeat-containing protein n=1 Tax=Nocardioides houyundeii TaxID=2045452 RepID=UPI000C78D995|nr:DUF4097 family beta strand repeat-containing protein [Nocardioides houyundeii]
MNHRFHTPDPIQLRAEVGRGTLTIDAADEARAQGETRVDVEGPHSDLVEVTQHGDQISVLAPPPRFGFESAGEQSLHVTVVLPTGSDAVLRTGSARTKVTGSLATLAVKSGSGEVEVARLAGQALLETGSGQIRIDVVAGELQAKSGSGDIVLGLVTAPATLSTGSGDVTVQTVEAELVVKTGSGDLTVTHAAADLSMATGSGDVRLTKVQRGRVGVRGASGDVRLGIPGGTPVWTDITTLSGAIRSDLPPTGEPADGQDHVEVRAKTVSGDVVLTQL